MSEYNHSFFLNQKSDKDFVANLDPEGRQTLHDFFDRQILSPTHTLFANNPADQPVQTNYGRTPNDIFIAHHQLQGTEMSPDPESHRIVTCRRFGNHMVQEAYEVMGVKYTAQVVPGRMDRIIEAKGEMSSRLVVMEMARSALWIELDNDGRAIPLPIKPFRFAIS